MAAAIRHRHDIFRPAMAAPTSKHHDHFFTTRSRDGPRPFLAFRKRRRLLKTAFGRLAAYRLASAGRAIDSGQARSENSAATFRQAGRSGGARPRRAYRATAKAIAFEASAMAFAMQQQMRSTPTLLYRPLLSRPMRRRRACKMPAEKVNDCFYLIASCPHMAPKH